MLTAHYINKGNSVGREGKAKQLSCYRPLTVVESGLLFVAAAVFLLADLLLMSPYLHSHQNHSALIPKPVTHWGLRTQDAQPQYRLLLINSRLHNRWQLQHVELPSAPRDQDQDPRQQSWMYCHWWLVLMLHSSRCFVQSTVNTPLQCNVTTPCLKKK